MEKCRAKASENKARRKDHKIRVKEQTEYCQQLHTRLQVIRLSRQETARIEAKAQNDEKLHQERIKARRQQRFR